MEFPRPHYKNRSLDRRIRGRGPPVRMWLEPSQACEEMAGLMTETPTCPRDLRTLRPQLPSASSNSFKTRMSSLESCHSPSEPTPCRRGSFGHITPPAPRPEAFGVLRKGKKKMGPRMPEASNSAHLRGVSPPHKLPDPSSTLDRPSAGRLGLGVLAFTRKKKRAKRCQNGDRWAW